MCLLLSEKTLILLITKLEDGPSLKAEDLTTLVSGTDYLLIDNGRAIERLDTNFAARVKVTYVPITDTIRRDRVVIDLCKLAIQNEGGVSAERSGDYSRSMVSYQEERERILSTLSAGRRAYA